MIEFYTAISVGCALDSVARAYRGALERLQGLGVVEEGCARDLASTHENGSLGMQCDKIVDFSEGTDAKSANLPKNPQSLHSHTANTNFVACSSEITESTTPKNLSKALPNINNVRNSASRAESMAIDSAIFAQQKSNKICSAAAHTDARPCRGGKNQEQGGSSATADFSKETSFCLDKDTARLSPRLPKRPNGLQAQRSKNSGALFFSGLGRAGRGETLFSFAQTSDDENLENIRENTTPRNLESIESNAEILKDTQLSESSHLDSETITESKEILKNEKIQNLGGIESKAFTESSHIDSQQSTQPTPKNPNRDSQNKPYVRLKPNFLIGILDLPLGKSHAFLTPLHPHHRQDLIIKNLPRNAFSGDIVLAKIESIKQGKRKGIMRYKKIARFVCVLEAREGFAICVLLQQKGAIYALNLQNAQRYTPKASQKSLRALPPNCVIKINLRSLEITKVLGVLDDARIDTQIVLEQYTIAQDFTPQSLLLAQSYGTRVLRAHYPHRRDYTHLEFCVIDPKGAKDHDDAIYYDERAQTLYVAIADVSEYVSKNSALDKEARERGFSVYFPDCVVPMLPFALSSGLCSLQKNRLRLALVWEISLSEGRAVDARLYEGIIKAREHRDYDSLDSLLEGDSLPQSLQWLKSYIPQVRKLRANRLRSGYDLHSPDVRIELDSLGEVARIRLETSSLSHHIIEESMLLANIAAAQMLHTHAPSGIYRIHQPPKESKISQLLYDMQELGAPIVRGELRAQIAGIQSWARERGEQFAQVIDTLIIRSFAKACYSATPAEHFGLGFSLYTHFTSPIRRYSDLCVHRILKSLLRETKELEYLCEHTQSIAQELNLKQKAINRLEREFNDYKSVRYVLGLLEVQKSSRKRALVCEAIVLGERDDGFVRCLALTLIPHAYVLVDCAELDCVDSINALSAPNVANAPNAVGLADTSGELEKFATLCVRIVGADLIAREIYGVALGAMG
ncbi:RNB domain-containing ribonuclease [uncultured Helicobacter sp.]|uniref:RNB domain-containing ribonuclease n=1 Tax=uncultured Helicobacter sp. TaxID=175537 RepID=UPI003752D4DD